MDTKIDTPQAETAPEKTKYTKVWLVLIPVLGLCGLLVCFSAAGLWVGSGWFGAEETEEAAEVAVAPQTAAETEPEPTATALPPTPTATTLPPTAAAFDSLPTPAEPVLRQPLPEACQTDPWVTGSALGGQPRLSTISFATAPDETGWPLDASVQFSPTISQVQASFSFAGLRNGLAWERVWYFADQELTRGQGSWDAGPYGQLSLNVQAGAEGFVPGRYRLEIYVEEQLLGQGSFLIAPADEPTEQPIQVAYTSWVGELPQINLLDLDSREVQPLVEAARSPGWAPDSDHLLFYSPAGLNGNQPGILIQQLTPPETNQVINSPFSQDVAWSVNGLHLATWIEREAGPNLVLWNLASGEAVEGPVGSHPAWSPDGRRLVFRSCSAEGWGLSTVEIIDHDFVRESLQSLTSGDDSQPSWSPDGQQIAYVRWDPALDSQDIYVVNSDGSQVQRLTETEADNLSPAWTPDNRLLFRSQREGQWGIYLMAADGSNPELLVETEAKADWQPDGLAVSSNVAVIEPTPTPVPKPQVQVPAGQGVLIVSNVQNNDEMTFTIDNFEHKIPPYQYRSLPLNPGSYTWTASWPGKNSRSGRAEIGLGQVAYPVVER